MKQRKDPQISNTMASSTALGKLVALSLTGDVSVLTKLHIYTVAFPGMEWEWNSHFCDSESHMNSLFRIIPGPFVLPGCVRNSLRRALVGVGQIQYQ